MAYKKCYDINKTNFDFYQIIFYNFIEHNGELMLYSKPNNLIAFKIYPCIEDKDTQSVINFFNSYSFFHAMEPFFTLPMKGIPLCVIYLKDNRLALCLSCDPSVIVLDPSNDFHVDLKIPGKKYDYANSIAEVENGNIVSVTNDKSIYVYSITKDSYKIELIIEKAHNKTINKVIVLPNNIIATCSSVKIKLWDMSTYLKKEPIRTLEGNVKRGFFSLMYFKPKNYLISGGLKEEDLYIWNLETYQCVSVFKGVEGYYENNLYQLDDARIVAGGVYVFNIVNLNIMTIEETVNVKELDCYIVSCFLQLRDGSLLCGTSTGDFILYNLTTKMKVRIQTIHSNLITDIKKIDDYSFYTTSSNVKFCMKY